MASDASGFDAEVLLRHRGFVAALAARLLADVNDAEDVEQDAWLAALDHPPRRESRSWLLRVVHNLARNRARGDRHRLARERGAARTEATPSTLDLLARLEMERRVVDAVREMAEPFRTVVLLRYYEDLAPREIAERLSIPIDTVHSRLKRGIERLRANLAERHGPDWKAALLPLIPSFSPKATAAAAAGGAVVATGLVTTGVLSMTTTKLAATLVALAAIGGAIWYAAATKTTFPRLDRALAAAPETRAVESPPPVAASPAPEVAARSIETASPVPATSETANAATGSLRVHVSWSDQTPAPGVLVEVERNDDRGDDDGQSGRARRSSDDHGDLHFAELPPGQVFAHALRGDSEGADWVQVKVEAGHESEAKLTLGVGMNVNGLVVDGHDAPVADAEILVSDWGGGEAWPLARSATDGTFKLRSVGTHTHIGARAPGFAPSSLRQFTASKGAEVPLRIVLSDTGVALSGRVLGPLDAPVAGAIVRAGDSNQKMHALPDGGTAMAPRPETVRTDAEGRFTFRALPIGKVLLAARARGLAPWKESVETTAGRANEITIRLEQGVTVVGTVTDDAGAAVAHAEIEIGRWEDIGHRRLVSDANGAFRGEGLATGKLELHASGEKRGKAQTTLSATAGETVRWDAVLARGLEFRGRVLDVDDQPVEGAMVETRVERNRPGVEWWAYANTGKDGRFVLEDCTADLVFSLSVRRKSVFPEVQLSHLVAGGEERVIHLPKEGWTRIRGRVLDPEGEVVPNVHVSPSMPGANGSPAETTDATGAFDLGPYPPGELHLTLHAAGYPTLRLGPHHLDRDEVWDLGTLRFTRGGTLAVAVSAESGAPPDSLYWSIFDASGESAEYLTIVDGQAHSTSLVPGAYALQVSGKDVACEQIPFEIREGEETALRVALRTGIAVTVDLAFAEGEASPLSVPCVVTDAGGRTVLRGSAWGRDTPRLQACLPPGSYTIVATGESCRGEMRLEVPTSGALQTRLEMIRR